jgi:BNR repeat-like domain
MVTLFLALGLQLPPIVSVTPASTSAFKDPQIAIENGGHVYLAYGSRDAIYVSVSRNMGKNYSAPILVGEVGKLSLGRRSGPRIVARNGKVTITAIYGAKGRGADGDIVVFRSDNHGETWVAGTKVNDLEGSAREGLHAMAVAPNGTIACAWLDLRAKGTTLYLSTSRDGGTTWSKNRLVYESPGGSVCECCHPSLAYDRSGQLNIMFRNSLNGARDMYLTSTRDDGNTFSLAQKLGNGTWVLDACPMDGGMVATGAKGSLMTIWRRDDSVFASAPMGKEVLMGKGGQPWGAYSSDGFYALWSGPKGIAFMSPKFESAIISGKGENPVLAASPDLKILVGAWTDKGIKSVQLTYPTRLGK